MTARRKPFGEYETWLASLLDELRLDWAAQVTFRNSDTSGPITIGQCRADFVLIGLDVVIEIDDVGHDNYDQHALDRQKDMLYRSKGFDVLRIKTRDMDRDIASVVQSVRDIVYVAKRRRGW